MSADRKLPAAVLAVIGLAVGAAGAVLLLFVLPDNGTNQLWRLLLGYLVWVAIAAGILVLGDRALRRRRPTVTKEADPAPTEHSGEGEASDR